MENNSLQSKLKVVEKRIINFSKVRLNKSESNLWKNFSDQERADLIAAVDAELEGVSKDQMTEAHQLVMEKFAQLNGFEIMCDQIDFYTLIDLLNHYGARIDPDCIEIEYQVTWK